MTANSSPQLWIYDTTLRDGTQREGLSVSIEDKLRIARRLDKNGNTIIKRCWPGAKTKDFKILLKKQEETQNKSEILAI